jgi:hypothetical protein
LPEAQQPSPHGCFDEQLALHRRVVGSHDAYPQSAALLQPQTPPARQACPDVFAVQSTQVALF